MMSNEPEDESPGLLDISHEYERMKNYFRQIRRSLNTDMELGMPMYVCDGFSLNILREHLDIFTARQL